MVNILNLGADLAKVKLYYTNKRSACNASAFLRRQDKDTRKKLDLFHVHYDKATVSFFSYAKNKTARIKFSSDVPVEFLANERKVKTLEELLTWIEGD